MKSQNPNPYSVGNREYTPRPPSEVGDYLPPTSRGVWLANQYFHLAWGGGRNPEIPLSRVWEYGNSSQRSKIDVAWLDSILIVKYTLMVPKQPRSKPITVAEAGRRGGKSRAERYSHAQLSAWAKLGGWPKGRPRKPQKTKKKGGK